VPTSENLPLEDEQLNETKLKEQLKRDLLRNNHLPPIGYKPSRIIRKVRKDAK
jgi:hypothetical protein